MKEKEDWYVKSYQWNPPEEVEYLNKLHASINWDNPREIYDRASRLYQLHEEFREKSCVNLVASENVMSETAKRFLGSNLGFRVCDGPVGKKVFGIGIQYLEEMEGLCIELSKELFNAEFVEHRLLSGTMGCAAIQFALTKKGNITMSQASDEGGSVGNRPEGPAKYIGLRVIDLPWDYETYNIDLEMFEERVKQEKPSLIITGAMIMLFPYPLSEMAKIAGDVGALIAYDGAHIGALAAGGQFQQPLKEGADVFMVNTHKQMGGPPGSLILTNDADIAKRIAETTFPFLVQTPYCNKFASLAVSLSELLGFGKEYAKQIVLNAKALAKGLDERGVNVVGKKLGFTESHQVLMNVRAHGGGFEAERNLVEAYVICNKMPLPGDKWNERGGIRLGVNEVTRRGMKEQEMKKLAEYITRVIVEKEPPESVLPEVKEFMMEYQKVHYCWNP